MILAIVSTYLLVMYFLRLIYLIFQPNFLPKEIFGNSSKLTLILGYLAIIFIMIVIILTSMGFIVVNVNSDVNLDFKNYNSNGLIIAITIGLIAASIATYLSKEKK